MSVVIYYPEAPADDLWMAQERLTCLYAGLEAADLHWGVNLVLGRPRPGVSPVGEHSPLGPVARGFFGPDWNPGGADLADLLARAPADMVLLDDEIWLARLDCAAVVHAPASATVVRLAESRRRGRLDERLKIVWSPSAGDAPATQLARRLGGGGEGLEPPVRERLVAYQRWIDNSALAASDAILAECASDLEAFATSAAGREALSAAATRLRIQPRAVEAPLLPEPGRAVRRRLGLEDAFVIAALGDSSEGGQAVQLAQGASGRRIAFLTLSGGRALVADAHGWSERGWAGPPDLLAACDAWVDLGEGGSSNRRLTVQALSLGKPGTSADEALKGLPGVFACRNGQGLAVAARPILDASAEDLHRRGDLNRIDYLDRFAPAEAARRYVATMEDLTGGPLIPFAPRPPGSRRSAAPGSNRVTVILPAYNVARFLDACLASICGQTHGDLEIIVVNDGAADASPAIIHAWAKRDPRIVVVDQLNAGLSAARNAGLDLATGDYICFVDGDDWIREDYVERLLRCAKAEDLDLVCCAIDYDLPGGEVHYHSTLHAKDAVTALIRDGVLDLSDKTILADLFPSAWNKLYRRRLFDRVRFPVGLYYEDHPVFFAVGVKLDRIGYIDDPLYYQRIEHGGNITQEAGERLFDIFPILRSVFQIIDEAMKPPASSAMFRQVALRLLWERSNLIVGRDFAERFAAAAERLFRETGVDGTQPRAADSWIPSAARYRFQQMGTSDMQCSVVLTYANDAKYVGALLDGLEQQTLRQIEVIAVDNGSGDGASAIVAAKCATDPRFTRLVHQGAVGGARNAGAAVARGKYVLFAEGNDLLAREALEKLVGCADDHDADVALCAFEYFGPEQAHRHNGLHASFITLPRQEKVGGDRLPIEGRKLVADVLAFPCNKLFRRSFLEAHAIAFETDGFYEEHAFWCDVADAAPRVAYTGEALYRVRDEPSARRLWSGGAHAFDTIKALRSLARRLDRPEDQPLLAKLCVRLAWERLTFSLTTPTTRAAFAAACREVAAHLDPALLASERDEYISSEFVVDFLIAAA